MVFLTRLSISMKYFGISGDEHQKGSWIRNHLLFVMCSLPMSFNVLPNIAYLIVFHNSENVLGITHLIYAILINGGTWMGYLIMAIRQRNLRELIDELKSVVASSECWCSTITSRKGLAILFSGELTSAKDIYVETANLLDKICRIYAVICVIGALGVFVMPYAKPLYHYLIGEYSFASWYTPYKTL